MMVPWTAAQHVDMHWRPDAVTRTGVIQPMWIRQVSPVDMATHTIDPFIASVRGRGPAVSPYPSPEDVAYAAGKLAQLFARGQSGVVCLGTEKIRVDAQTPPGGGIVGTIVQAAQELARGGTVKIQIGARSVLVCNSGPGGEPAIAPTATAQSGQATSMNVRPDQQPSGFGFPLLAPTTLPTSPGPGNVPQFPFLDYGEYRRMLTRDDNMWSRRTFQAQLAQRFAPNAIAAMNAVNSVPVQQAQRQAQPALMSRAPMAQKRLPDPARVFPQQVPPYRGRGNF